MMDEPPRGEDVFQRLLEQAAAELGEPITSASVQIRALLMAQMHALRAAICRGEIISTAELLSLQERVGQIEPTAELKVFYTFRCISCLRSWEMGPDNERIEARARELFSQWRDAERARPVPALPAPSSPKRPASPPEFARLYEINGHGSSR